MLALFCIAGQLLWPSSSVWRWFFVPFERVLRSGVTLVASFAASSVFSLRRGAASVVYQVAYPRALRSRGASLLWIIVFAWSSLAALMDYRGASFCWIIVIRVEFPRRTLDYCVVPGLLVWREDSALQARSFSPVPTTRPRA